jgi:hypothetical protein
MTSKGVPIIDYCKAIYAVWDKMGYSPPIGYTSWEDYRLNGLVQELANDISKGSTTNA